MPNFSRPPQAAFNYIGDNYRAWQRDGTSSERDPVIHGVLDWGFGNWGDPRQQMAGGYGESPVYYAAKLSVSLANDGHNALPYIQNYTIPPQWDIYR